jgi:hypothetical protein
MVKFRQPVAESKKEQLLVEQVEARQPKPRQVEQDAESQRAENLKVN